MSIYSRIKSESPIEPISKDKTPFYLSNTNKGSECLMFNDDELHDEGGHYITFYPNGALLSLKESCKYYPDSKSFIFYNNDGKKVFELYNSIKDKSSNHPSGFLPPEKDIDVKIYRSHILVRETNLKNLSETEYFISIKTGEKLVDWGKTCENQFSMDI